jgi:hypothetical protein
LQGGARITKPWLVKNQGNNLTFGLFVDSTWYRRQVLELMRMSMGKICSTEDFTSSTGFSDFLVFSTTVDN